MKKCIVHLPNKIKPEMASASQIRPIKMIEAFRNIGYEVDVVEGYASDRKRAIKEIEYKINNGTKYDFMYSESSTMPTLLTDPSHLPLHPFLDFGFFSFLKERNIKIGLFYRDIYWKFPAYKETVKGLKGKMAVAMYQYDLRQYSKLLDKLYLPTEEAFRYVDSVNATIMDTLPPGCELKKIKKEDSKGHIFTLLYIGGLGNHYRIQKVLKAMDQVPEMKLIICCREQEWRSEKNHLEGYLTDRVEIVHRSGTELEELYEQADIGLLLLEPDSYRKIAMPYKTFEYIGHGLPIISSEKTAVDSFIKDNDIGWTTPYDESSIMRLLRFLLNNPTEIDNKRNNSKMTARVNRWEDRALKVALDLA